MRGPKPQPAKIIAIKGNPGKRAIRKDAPGVGTIGEPPADMCEAAAEKWNESAREWAIVLTASDRDALRLYCETWAEMLEAQKRVKEDGVMVVTPNGFAQKSPWMTKLEQSREFCRRMLAEFGGSPSSRARVSAKAADEQTEAAARYFG